ncbi:hypothetical protein pb186bvf_015931 [Paramecium bursaria]
MKMGSFILHQQNAKHLDEFIYFVYPFGFILLDYLQKYYLQNKNKIRNFIMSLVRPSHQLESHLLHKYDGDQSPLKTIIIASLQTGLAFFVEFLPNTATVIFLVKQKLNLDIRIWLGFMWGQAFGFGLLQGISCYFQGLETLVSQAWCENSIVQINCFINSNSIFMVFSGPILSLINRQLSATEITDATWPYTRLLMPCVLKWIEFIQLLYPFQNTFVLTNTPFNHIHGINNLVYGQVASVISVALNYLFISDKMGPLNTMKMELEFIKQLIQTMLYDTIFHKDHTFSHHAQETKVSNPQKYFFFIQNTHDIPQSRPKPNACPHIKPNQILISKFNFCLTKKITVAVFGRNSTKNASPVYSEAIIMVFNGLQSPSYLCSKCDSSQ